MGKTYVTRFPMSRARRVSWIGAIATGLFAACSAGEGGEGVSSLQQGVTDLILLNEIVADPPTGATAHQYIELRGTPSGSLSEYYVVVLNGDGEATFVVELDTACGAAACQLGSNGQFLITKPGGHTAAASTPSISDNSLAFPTGATRSILLIQSPSTPMEEGTDYGALGVLALPTGATLLDAVGWDNGPGDVYGGVSLPLLPGTSNPDAMSRIVGNDTPKSVGAWFYGELEGGASTTTYDPDNVSANTPAGATLSPGAPNFDPSSTGSGGAGGGGAGGDGGTSSGGTAGEGGVPQGTSGEGGATGGVGGEPSVPEPGGSGGDEGSGGDGSGGVAGDAGAGGSGPVTGGTAGSSSVAGRAGASTTGGVAGSTTGISGAPSGGRAGAAGAAGTPGSDDDDDGCGCRTPGRGSPNNGAFAALAAALAVVLRRRRRT